MWKEFKEFTVRGNVVDLALAVIIGTAFGKIVESLVHDLIMPVFGVVLGGVNLSAKSFILGKAVVRYGAFLQTMVDFFIIAFSIFLVFRFLKRKEVKKSEPEATRQGTVEEIRDLLIDRLPETRISNQQPNFKVIVNGKKDSKKKKTV